MECHATLVVHICAYHGIPVGLLRRWASLILFGIFRAPTCMVNCPNFSFVGSPTTAGTGTFMTWKVVREMAWDVDRSQPSDLVAIT